MRSEVVHRTSRGRECLYPEVPRTFHHGSKGTFMSPVLHQQFFASIATATDRTLEWPPHEWGPLRDRLASREYEARLRARIAAARPVVDLRKLLLALNASAGRGGGSRDDSSSSSAGGDASGGLALWYTQPPRSASVTVFKEIATLVGLWHEPRRSAHRGVHDLWCGGHTRLLLVNTLDGPDAAASPYADLAPPAAQIFTSGGDLKAAARKAFTKLGRRAQTAICRTRGPRR